MELPGAVGQLQIPLLYLNNIFALGFQPGYFRIILTLPTALLLLVQPLYEKNPDYYGKRYPMNCLAMYVMFAYLDWIILASPDKQRWTKFPYRKQANATNETTLEIPHTFLGRLWWGIRLASTNRYTGWSQEVKNTPVEVSADYPRW